MKGRKYFVFLSAVSLLFLWQLLSVKVGYDFILPAPVQVLTRMGSLLLEQTFYEAIGATAIRSLFGLMLAFFLAAVFALLSFKSDCFAQLFAPLLLLMRSIPNISYILLILYWFSRDISSIIISFLILFPMIYQTLLESMKEMDQKYLDVLKIYPKGRMETFFRVYLPLLRPAVSSSICNGIAMAFKVGVMAEILGQVPFGVGRQMQLARLNFDLVSVMAWTGWIIILLYVCDRLLQRLISQFCSGV